MHEKQVILAVLAHPDDESFGMGGTLALYAQRGVDVHLVCATRGEVGMIDPELMTGFETIADRRMSELRCAAGILGLAGVYFLDYRDSGMAGSADNQHPNALAAAPLEEVAQRVAVYIRRHKPQVVLTFDPIGGYKHPDHIAIHNATVRAFELAADPSFENELPPYQAKKLYYHVMSKKWMRYLVRLLPLFGRDPRRFGKNGDIDLLELIRDGDFPIHARLDIRPVEELKESAAACHVSQLGGGMPRKGFLNWLMRNLNRGEGFMRAYPPAPNGLRERDLFEGI